jgi:hypothetical protein
MSKNSTPAVRETFVVAMPDDAPLGFDPFADGFTWQDVLPQNYMSLDWLESKVEALGGNPIVTPARIVIQPVIDPEEKDPDLAPKIVMEFVENVPALVFNKTRCTLAQKLTGNPNPRRWAELLPALEIYAGAYRDMAVAMQILFRPVGQQPRRNGNGRATPHSDGEVDEIMRPRKGYTVEDANDDLM